MNKKNHIPEEKKSTGFFKFHKIAEVGVDFRHN